MLEGAFVHTAAAGSSISALGRSFRDEIYSGRKNRDSEMRDRKCTCTCGATRTCASPVDVREYEGARGVGGKGGMV